MTASIISDLNSLMMPAAQTSEPANSGSGFEDIFNSVNKNYSQNDSSVSKNNEKAQNINTNADTKNIERNASDEKKSEVKSEKDKIDYSKKTESKDDSAKNDSLNNSEKNVQNEVKAKDDTENSPKVEQKISEVAQELSQNRIDTVVLQLPAETQPQVEQNGDVEPAKGDGTPVNQENNLPQEGSVPADNQGRVPEVLPVNQQSAQDVLSLLVLNNQSQGEASGLEKALANQSKTIAQASVNRDYAMPQPNQNAQAPALNPSLQPQTQLPNVNVQAETSANIPQLDANVVSDVQIQVSEDLATDVASKVVTADKQVIKDALSTSSLTQEMLDKTDARVVSVSTSSDSSSSNSNNLLNQQNAQEQAVKLSLESSNSTLQGTADSLTQPSSFDKTLQSVQTPPQAQAHTSHELSKADILSQIHTRLNNFQDDASSKVTIILKPESLGKIHLELVTSKEGLTAQMTTDNVQVKELLDKNLEGLKETLSNQGVNVNNVSVKVSETQKQDGMFSFDGQGEQNKQNPQSGKNAETGAFSSDEDAGDFLSENEFEGDSLTEASNVKVQHEGQVDYKI